MNFTRSAITIVSAALVSLVLAGDANAQMTNGIETKLDNPSNNDMFSLPALGTDPVADFTASGTVKSINVATGTVTFVKLVI